jgi:2,5-dihydroxypyridine 5,6-dioxygenase
MKAADVVVIFHVPLFTKWLKEVMETGTRVLMIIDAPDDLEQLMAPPGLKEAIRRTALSQDPRGPRYFRSGHRFHL